MNTQLLVPGDHASATLHIAIAAYLARYKGHTRAHAESDLRSFLTWCERQGLDPLAARRPHIELFLRWMQEVCRYKPSTGSRRLSIVAGFYRTCVIDGLLEHSPAEYVRRPRASVDSPTLGLSHLQLEAMLSAGRQSANINDFALVTMLGLLGLRIFEATGRQDRSAGGSSRTPGAARVGQGRQGCAHPAATGRGTRDRQSSRRPHRWPDPAEPHREPDGSSLRHP